jgi:hypothetical protein
VHERSRTPAGEAVFLSGGEVRNREGGREAECGASGSWGGEF